MANASEVSDFVSKPIHVFYIIPGRNLAYWLGSYLVQRYSLCWGPAIPKVWDCGVSAEHVYSPYIPRVALTFWSHNKSRTQQLLQFFFFNPTLLTMSSNADDGFKHEVIPAEVSEDISSTGNEIKPLDYCDPIVIDGNIEAGIGGRQLKLAPDGHTVLIPQPSDNPGDPLNWSKFRKHLCLYIIAACAFLPDYGSSVGAVTLLPQATYIPLELTHLARI